MLNILLGWCRHAASERAETKEKTSAFFIQLLLSKKWFLKPASTEYFGGPSKKSTLFLSLVFIIPCLFRVFCYYYPWSFREEGLGVNGKVEKKTNIRVDHYFYLIPGKFNCVEKCKHGNEISDLYVLWLILVR